jgi:hypothetical protein
MIVYLLCITPPVHADGPFDHCWRVNTASGHRDLRREWRYGTILQLPRVRHVFFCCLGSLWYQSFFFLHILMSVVWLFLPALLGIFRVVYNDRVLILCFSFLILPFLSFSSSLSILRNTPHHFFSWDRSKSAKLVRFSSAYHELLIETPGDYITP